MKVRQWMAICFLLASIVTGTSAHADKYPEKPIRLLIGTAPGGGVDIVARALIPRLNDELGQPLVVEYHPGPFAAQRLIASAPADGYTLFVCATTIAVNPTLFPSAGLDALRNTPISQLADTPTVLVIRSGLDVKDVAGLVHEAKVHPGKLTFASAGNGTPPFLAGQQFKDALGLSVLHIPYKGVSPALIDIAAGRIDFMFSSYGSARSLMSSGAIHAIALANGQRFKDVPELKTLREQGFDGATFSSWIGLVAPPNTPDSIVKTLNSAIGKVMKDDVLWKTMIDQGFSPEYSTPDEFRKTIAKDATKYRELIAKTGISAN